MADCRSQMLVGLEAQERLRWRLVHWRSLVLKLGCISFRYHRVVSAAGVVVLPAVVAISEPPEPVTGEREVVVATLRIDQLLGVDSVDPGALDRDCALRVWRTIAYAWFLSRRPLRGPQHLARIFRAPVPCIKLFSFIRTPTS
mgnify:CR=1 FL=1